MAYYISVKISDTQYKSFEVPKEIYTYILNLENYIKRPELSGLLKQYPDRLRKVMII